MRGKMSETYYPGDKTAVGTKRLEGQNVQRDKTSFWLIFNTHTYYKLQYKYFTELLLTLFLYINAKKESLCNSESKK
jgi:hypothetical protein